MEKIIINPDMIDDDDNILIFNKSRVIIVNDNKILANNYNGAFMLPGGKLKYDESFIDGAVREVSEEVGVKLEKDDLEPFVEIVYYQKGFPSRTGKFLDRKVVTRYFICNRDVIVDEENMKLSSNEIESDFSLEYYPLDGFSEFILNSELDNPSKEFFNKELLAVLYLYDRPCNVKVRIR